MKLTKKSVIAMVIALICVVGVAVVLSIPKNSQTPTSTETEAPAISQEAEESPVSEEDKKETKADDAEVDPTANDENINGLDKPIFMYFVTNADLENKDTKATLDKLQKEYKDKVIFDIKNADDDKSLYDNFPIKGSMPMLIMQKKGGDISTFLFANNNYDELKAAIDATL